MIGKSVRCPAGMNNEEEPAVTTTPSPALKVARAYFDAWTHKDLDRAMTYIAENILCDAPAGRVRGAGAYRAFMAPFMQSLANATIIAAFGNDQTAMLMYDTKTIPARPTGRSWLVFDGTPFEEQRH